MGIKELLLNKGWAGTTMTRRETAERLNPLLRPMYELLHVYDYAIRRASGPVAEQLEAFQRTHRADIGKVAETILSCGAAPYNGVDQEPLDGGESPAALFERARDLEGRFLDMLDAELKQEHQIRTRAVLGVVRADSAARLDYVRTQLKP